MFADSFTLTNGLVSINPIPTQAMSVLIDNPAELLLLKRGANTTQTEKYWCWPVYLNHSKDFELDEEKEFNINHGELINFPDPVERLIGFYTVGTQAAYIPVQRLESTISYSTRNNTSLDEQNMRSITSYDPALKSY